VSFYGAFGRLAPGAERESPARPGKWESFTAYLYFPVYWRQLWVGRSLERVFAYEVSANHKTLHFGPSISFGAAGVGQVRSGWHLVGSRCGPKRATYVWSTRKRTLVGRARATRLTISCLLRSKSRVKRGGACWKVFGRASATRASQVVT
jgi:hypothetical protein